MLGGRPRRTFPEGKRCAFTIMDDTDVGTVENVGPVYRLLESLGMRATKTVWPHRCEEGSANFGTSETLEDEHYLRFVLDLQNRGFEIAFHGATMETSTRERTVAALTRFRETFGAPPRVHANHSLNRENLYWGADRIDRGLLRVLYRWALPEPPDHYQGHLPGSPYWWGDLCAASVHYVRNLTFNDINLMNINPSMPYRDASRPHVRRWFSASDAEDADAFVGLLAAPNQDRLERESGVCIVATHFGKGYASGGVVRPDVEGLLARMASKDAWFPTVVQLLDWLAEQGGGALPSREWKRMQWLWARDLLLRKLQRRRLLTTAGG